MGEHTELSALDHEGCEMHHEWIGLQMEVAEHFVGAPAADQFDNVGINLAAKESHGATCAEGASGNVPR